MINNTIEDFYEKKLHLGHPAREWNPKMAPYIYMKQKGFYIIDLLYTYIYLQKAKKALKKAASKNSTFLFVGTKPQASGLIKKYAEECQSFYINQKWLGGLLTNWKTVSRMTKSLQDPNINKNTKTAKKGKVFSSKKDLISLEKKRQKLDKIIGGIKEMRKLPDIVIIIGAFEEINAVRECNKLGIPIVTILDTNCDPDIATWGVPANDDSLTSIDKILSEFSKAILTGRSLSKKTKKKQYKKYTSSKFTRKK